jgi:hypothetical protein
MTEELKKINLDTAGFTPPPVQKTTKSGKTTLIILASVLGVFVLLIGGLILALMPLKAVAAQAQVVMKSAKQTATYVKDQDLTKMKEGLVTTRKDMDTLQKEFNKVKGLSVVPFLGNYIKDGEHAINAGFAGLTAADRAMEALEPNADLLGFKGGSKFIFGNAEERIQTAVKTMKALTPKINEMSVNIEKLRTEIDAIDANRYPEMIGKTKVRSQIVNLKDTVTAAAGLFVNAQPLLTSLPAILGEPTDRRYIVLLQNDKELRSTGGFLTAYAQFRITRGKITLEKSDDIYHLDASLTKKFPATREISTFHKGVYQLYIRDSNLSPDYKVSMQQFETMYNTSSSKEKIDGIIALDTHVLVEMLKILGPTVVYDREFSATIDKRCDCARAIYELEDYSSRPVGYVREDRKDIIGVLMREIMYKALGFSPSQYWGRLFQMLLSEINQKHIFAYFKDPVEQKASESFNMAGRIMTLADTASILKYKEGQNWDYLHVNNSNMAGAKSNMFVSEKMLKDVTVNSDGTISTKLTLDYKNPYAHSDCGTNQAIAGLCLNAPLRNWIRVYAPKGSKLVDSKGTISPQDSKPKAMETYDSLEKTVFEGFMIVDPMGSARVELSYTSPVKLEGGKYQLLWQKQGGTDNQEVTVKLNGKERKKLPLQSDMEFVL